MNSCELNFGRNLKKEFQGKSKEEVTQRLSEIVHELKIPNTGDFQAWALDIINRSNTNEFVTPAVSINKFFYYNVKGREVFDAQAAIEFKTAVISKIFEAIFNTYDSDFELTNDSLTDLLNTISDMVKSNLNIEDLHSEMQFYFNHTFSEDNRTNFRKNADLLSDFFIATQLPTIVKAYMGDIITYNEQTGKYQFAIKAHIKQNWSDDKDEKPAEMNGLLKMMCENTPVLVFENGNSNPKVKGNVRLTQNSFMWAWQQFIDNLSETEYQNFLENPRSIIPLLQQQIWGENAGKGSLNLNSLEGTVLRSFAYKWLNPDSNFYKNFSKQAFNAKATNPIEVILANLRKYASQKYMEYNVNGQLTKLDLNLNDGGAAYSRLIDNIEMNKEMLMSRLYETGMVNKTKDNYTLAGTFTGDPSSISFTDKQMQALRQIFGYQLNLTSTSDKNHVIEAVHTFIEFYNSHQNSFNAFRNDPSKSKNERGLAAAFIDVCKNTMRYNPYAVEGAIKNALDKSLPTIGLKNVGSNIEDEIRLNRIHKKESDLEYDTAIQMANADSETKVKLIKPTSPAAHSSLYNTDRTKASTQLYKETIYRTTLILNTDEEPIVKDPSEFSKEEWFELTVNSDILKPLFNVTEGDLRIQAITTSDKPKIPIFTFNKEIFINKYAAGNDPLRNLTKFNLALKQSMQKQISSYYQQYLLNSINDFIQVFQIEGIQLYSNINELGDEKAKLKYLNTAVAKINQWLLDNNVTVTTLNEKLFAFNNKFGLNKNIARYQDYDIVDGHIQVAPFSVKACNAYDESQNFETFYTILQDSLHKFPPSFTVDSRTAQSYLDENGKLKRDKNGVPEILGSKFFTFFATQGILSTELLVNVVGLPLSHKYGSGDFLKMDSKGQLTMVKRMVALTATMHQCNRNVLTGLPNQTKMMTIDVQKIKMFTYAGTTIDDNGWQSILECWDGAMIATGISHELTKQSIGDVKPGGIDLKLLMHYYNQEKAGAYLPKLASYAITNALIRMFGNSQAKRVGAFDPEYFMLLQLRTAKVSSLDMENDRFLDYNRDKLFFQSKHKIITDNGNEILYTSKWVYDVKTDTFNIKYIGTDGVYKDKDVTKEVIPYLNGKFTYNNAQITVENNLYNVWKYIFGGSNSCDASGEYSEGSQDNIVLMLNMMGRKTAGGRPVIEDQNDIDQYLKKQIVHFFPTQTVQKALQAPIVDINRAVENPDAAVTLRYGIEHFGIQMDADHAAEDSTIHEITQLISFISEHGYAPDLVRDVYKQLADLLTMVGKKVFALPTMEINTDEYVEWRNKINNLFSQMLTRVFTDPNLDVKSYANEIVGELKALELTVPFSDHQFLGKAHTTIGSYLNKFIARNWTGRADVLMPSHNLFMVYEDEDGIQYTNQDFKINPDGSKTRITRHLHDLVWNENGQMKQEFQDKFIVSNPYEFMPGLVYYRIPNERYLDENIESSEVEVVVMDDWNKMQEAKFELEKDPTERKYTYFKAIDLPRNLLPKHAFLNLSFGGRSFKIGMYYLKTIQEIAAIGEEISESADEVEAKKLIERKKQKQKYLDSVILPIITKANESKELTKEERQTIYHELPIGIINTIHPENFYEYNIWYTQKDSESLTTNNNSNVFGIKDMNISEIMQRKVDYFKEKLVSKFSNDAFSQLKRGYTLYTSGAKATKVMTHLEAEQFLNDWQEVSPVIDEDGFRVTEDGKKLYKLPDDAKIYINSLGNYSEEVIVTDYISRPEEESDPNQIYLLDSNFWVLYTADNATGTQPKLHELKLLSGNIANNPVINELANQQYDSFMKSLEDVVARIPSQSMAFAMVMQNIGYLPFNNNLRLVPLEHFYIQGSDVDIDKAYALMAYLNKNGVYNDRVSGLKFVEKIDGNDQNMLDLHNKIAGVININLAAHTPNSLDTLKAILSDAFQKYGKISISTDLLEQLTGSDYTSDSFKNAINLINSMKFISGSMFNNGINGVNVMQNVIRQNIINLYHNPKTLFVANYPTTMVPVRTAVAENSASKELRNSLDPTTNILVNQTCSVGKKGVGISANSQKAFYALTTMFERKFEYGESTLNPTKFGQLPLSWRYNGMDYLSNLGFAGARINRETINDLIKYFDSQTKEDPAISLRDLQGAERSITDGNGNEVVVTDYDHISYKQGMVFRTVITTLAGNSDVVLGVNYSLAYLDPNDFTEYPTESRLRKILEEDSEKIRTTKLNNIINSISNWQEVKIGSDLRNVTCTVINGAVISSATDNAKEMTMDLLNMVPEVLPAYEYLLSMGITIEQAAKIFTDKLIPILVQRARGNLFTDTIGKKRISGVINAMYNGKTINNDELSKIVKELIDNGEDVNTAKIETKQKLDMLKIIFAGADELTTLSQILSINGGIKVETGDQLAYQINFQDRVEKQLPEGTKISLFKFLYSDEDARKWAEMLQKNCVTYNVLEVLLSVPHFKSMLEVPVQFRTIMEGVSSDVKYAFAFLERNSYTYEVTPDNIKKIIRAINDYKILDFLHSLNFAYQSNYELKIHNNEIEDNTSRSLLDSPNTYNLNDDGYKGILNFKSHVENVIYPKIAEAYPDNEFVQNIVTNSFFWGIAKTKVRALASDINMSDPRNTFETSVLKTKFSEIKDDIIDGHTIEEWLFLYDLLVYHHQLNRNAFTILFGNIGGNKDNIVAKWIQFVNSYDAMKVENLNVDELYKLELEKTWEGKRQDSLREQYMAENEQYSSKSYPEWLLPNEVPLFVRIANHKTIDYANFNIVNTLIEDGIIFLKFC